MFTANQSLLQSTAKDYAQQLLAATISFGSAVTAANHAAVQTITESIDTKGVSELLEPVAKSIEQYRDWVQTMQKGFTR